jgi:hypothetical protein
MESSRPGRKMTILTLNKEPEIWEDKYQKEYVMICAIVSEEVSCHIVYVSDSYGALKRLNELYDTHSDLELIQLILKLFNLKLKNDDHMYLS